MAAIPLQAIREAIVSCERCPRLRTYCARIAREKRRADRDENYWGKAVPRLGAPTAAPLAFGNAVHHRLANGQVLIGCYHPSRQNTNTGKLTSSMMDDVFHIARTALCSSPVRR